MPPNTKLHQFYSKLHIYCREHGVLLKPWRKAARATLNIRELGAPANCILYAKVSNRDDGWWGINKNQFQKLTESGRDWCLVLLAGLDEAGYLFTHTQANTMASGLSQNATEYIVHEKQTHPLDGDLVPGLSCSNASCLRPL